LDEDRLDFEDRAPVECDRDDERELLRAVVGEERLGLDRLTAGLLR